MITHNISWDATTFSFPSGWVRSGDITTPGMKLTQINESNISMEVIAPFSNQSTSGALAGETHYEIPSQIWARYATIISPDEASIRLSGFTPNEAVNILFFGRSANLTRNRLAIVDGITYENGDIPDIPSEPTLIETVADEFGDVDVSFKSEAEEGFSAFFAGITVQYEIDDSPQVTIDETLTPGSNATISTSNFEGAITGARITDSAGNVKEITLDSPTQISLPALGTQSYCLFGDVTLEVYNATESATTTAVFNPPESYPHLVTLTANPENLTETGYLFNWNPDAGYEGAQVISPIEIDANGNIISSDPGTYTLYGIDDFDGHMQSFDVILQAPSQLISSSPVSITNLQSFDIEIVGNVTLNTVTLSDSTATVLQTINSQTYSAGSDSTTVNVTCDRGNLPYGTDYTLTVTTDDATDTTTCSLTSPWFVVDVVDPVTTSDSVFHQYNETFTGSAPATGMQLNSEKDVNANGTLKTVADLTTFTVELWRGYQLGWSDSVQVSLQEIVATSLVANFSQTNNFLQVAFTSAITYDGSDPLSYSWNFGDGNTSTEQNPTHTYGAAGTYTVELTVTDGTMTDVSTQQVTVEQVTLESDFTHVDNFLSVSFTDASVYDGNDQLTYSWDFGDGNTSTEQNPTHVYVSAGTYTVELTVTDGTVTDVHSLTIAADEQVILTADFDYSESFLELSFLDATLYNGMDTLSYLWDFGDGQTSNESDPTHVYASAGTYTVELTVTDGTVVDSYSEQVTVEAEEVAISEFLITVNLQDKNGNAPTDVEGVDVVVYSELGGTLLHTSTTSVVNGVISVTFNSSNITIGDYVFVVLHKTGATPTADFNGSGRMIVEGNV